MGPRVELSCALRVRRVVGHRIGSRDRNSDGATAQTIGFLHNRRAAKDFTSPSALCNQGISLHSMSKVDAVNRKHKHHPPIGVLNAN